MPRIWLWIREHIYIELERIAQEKGIGVDDLIKKVIEEYVQGKLIYKDNVNINELNHLKNRIDKLEEEVKEIKSMVKFLLRNLS